jgi:7-dehydrocholesterol reductase
MSLLQNNGLPYSDHSFQVQHLFNGATDLFVDQIKIARVKSLEIQSTSLTWGRSHRPSAFYSLIMLLLPPLVVYYFVLSCEQYQCNLTSAAGILSGITTPEELKIQLKIWTPHLSLKSFFIFITWYLLQALLYVYVPPNSIGLGQVTPAGHTLKYNINGLSCFLISNALFIIGSIFNFWRLSIIAHSWIGLVCMANIMGYSLTLFCYLKAHLFPTHADDRKFSRSILYDLYMGIEFNPRFGSMFDFKLFFNGRPGMAAWTLITLSFAAAQRESIGYVTNAMILVLGLHTLYVIDFFYNEDWYLRTIDIAHDHMGFYLCWGDSVWLPVMYTLQGQYLYRHPKVLPTWAILFITLIGAFGYFIFRSTNAQKDLVGNTNGQCHIWGRKPKVIRAKYVTSNGKVHTSLLLYSGWWGIARQVNYLGDIFISLAACLCCGVSESPLLGYFYVFWMIGLLVHVSQSKSKQKHANPTDNLPL